MKIFSEKTLLQILVALACAVPISAGLFGAVGGTKFLGTQGVNPELNSHFRYLSGLLFGIGLSFLCLIPKIEYNTVQFRLLTSIVVAGGVARVLGFAGAGAPSETMIFAIAMELVVTPILCLWQQRVARKFTKNS